MPGRYTAGLRRIGSTIQRAARTGALYKILADLPAGEESSGGAVAARAYEADSTVRYLGIEIDDALKMAEQTAAGEWSLASQLLPFDG